MNGHASNIKDKIYTDMQRESANFNYENAAKLRDRLETINKIISQQSIIQILVMQMSLALVD